MLRIPASVEQNLPGIDEMAMTHGTSFGVWRGLPFGPCCHVQRRRKSEAFVAALCTLWVLWDVGTAPCTLSTLWVLCTLYTLWVLTALSQVAIALQRCLNKRWFNVSSTLLAPNRY